MEVENTLFVKDTWSFQRPFSFSVFVPGEYGISSQNPLNLCFDRKRTMFLALKQGSIRFYRML